MHTDGTTGAPVQTQTVQDARRFRRGRRTRSARKIALGTAGIVGFLVTWQLLPSLGIVDPRYFPTATETLAQLGQDVRDLEFWRNVGRTLTKWGIGLLMATVLAVVLGTIIGLVPFLRRATHTTVEFLRPIPSVALIPLAVLLFGYQIQSALLIIVYASFWQVFIQVLYGVADVDAVARDTARSFGLSRGSRIVNLVFPTALPYLMTGVRLAAAVALILAITAEMFIGNPGLGREIVFAQSAGNWPAVYALVIVTGLLGLLINLVFRAIERRTLSWHQSVRGEDVL
ncbi:MULTISPECIES: ABC transporter permease [unclassified Microbacterium]|uniref:ABC transporter permease n=1 Tax=unclassified Microbacterium TaxID=2609290 RepID=UPI00214AAC22|nr:MULTISPECIES: ABC transporter permease [unclassified Microbacterium]MCR2808487.1 ABC transporter permease [Microbacterium sp. zg.B185]WIM19073.1 ABC transporter permease [Microbacterium sp. zg-B185]